MEKFTTLTAIAAPLPEANIDTDKIDLKRCNPVHPTPSLLHFRHEVPADKEKHMTEESDIQEPVLHTESETIDGANKATGKNGHDRSSATTMACPLR